MLPGFEADPAARRPAILAHACPCPGLSGLDLFRRPSAAGSADIMPFPVLFAFIKYRYRDHSHGGVIIPSRRVRVVRVGKIEPVDPERDLSAACAEPQNHGAQISSQQGDFQRLFEPPEQADEIHMALAHSCVASHWVLRYPDET